MVNSSISVAYFTICCWLNPNFRWDKSFNPILRWSKKLVRQNYNVLGKLWFHMSIHQEIEWILWICLMGVPIPLVHHFPIRSLAISIGYIHEQTQDHHKARGFFKAHRTSQKNPAGPVVILWGLSQLFCCWLCWLNYHRTTIANTTRLNYPLWVLLPTGMRKNLLPSIRRSYRVLEVNTPNPGQTLTPQPGQHLTTG